jgi:NAD(P)H-flavin reductase
LSSTLTLLSSCPPVLRSELDELAASSNGRFKIHYILNKPPPGWTGSTGFISKELIEDHLGRAIEFDDGKMLMCGPPPMITAMKSVVLSLSSVLGDSFDLSSKRRSHS